MKELYKIFNTILTFTRVHDKAILFSLGIIAIVYNLYFLFIPLDRDEGAYAYVAWLWTTHRGIPYLSVFDQKTPLDYAIYLLGVLINPNGFFGIRFVGLCFKIILLYVTFKLVKRLSSSFVAWFVVLLVSWVINSLRLEGNEFNTEVIMMLPLMLFVYVVFLLFQKLTTKRKILYLFAIGLCASFAFLGKTNAIFSILFILLWVFLKRKNLFEFVPIAIGFLLPILVGIIYFWSHHALAAMMTDVITYNHFYLQDGLKPASIASISGYKGIFGYFVWLTILPKVSTPFVLVALISWIVTIKKREIAWWISLLLCIGIFFAAKSCGSREFPHYYLPFTMVLVLACVPLWTVLVQKKQQIIISILTIILVGSILIPEVSTIVAGPGAIQTMQF